MRKGEIALKQIFAKILVFVLIFQMAMPVCAMPATEEAMQGAEGDGEGFSFTVEVNPYDESYVEITGFTGTLPEKLVIPETIDGATVFSIGDKAFNNSKDLKEVELPDTIQYLSGFEGCSDLEKINIPKSVEYIGMKAFKDCKDLEPFDINVDNEWGMLTIYDYAFSGCKQFENHDWKINSPVVSMYENALAGLKVKSLTLNGVFESMVSDASCFGEGEEAFENSSNVYYVNPDVIENQLSYDDGEAVYETFEECVATKPGATVVFQGDGTGMYYVWSYDVPGVEEIQLSESLQDDYEIVDGVLYRINEDEEYEAYWMLRGTELEDGIYYVPEKVERISEDFYNRHDKYAVNTQVNELVLPDTMEYLYRLVSSNEQPITVYLPDDANRTYTYNELVYNPGAKVTVVLPSSLANYEQENNIFSCQEFDEVNTVVIPEGMTSFPAYFLRTNADVGKLNVEIAEGNTTFKKEADGAIYSADGKTLYWWSNHNIVQGATIEIPEGVETIASYAFGDFARKLEPITLVLPESLKKYENNAVYLSDTLFDFRLVTNKCSNDVEVGITSYIIRNVYVNDPATSPFVKTWGNNKINNLVTSGVAKVNVTILMEAEGGKIIDAPYGASKVRVTKVTDSGFESVKSTCSYLRDGRVEILLNEGGTYKFDIEALGTNAYFPASVEDVEISLVSPEEVVENTKEVTVTLERRPSLRVESDANIFGYIYTEEGEYHSYLHDAYHAAYSNPLKPGNYKIVLSKVANKLLRQSNLSDLLSFGLVSGEDYLLKDLVITEETKENVLWSGIDFDGLAINSHALITSECSYTASSMDARMGYKNLNITYAIDSEKWDSSADSVKVMVTLPEGVTYIQDSAIFVAGDGTQSRDCVVTKDGNDLTFTLDRAKLTGRIRFSVTTTEEAEGISTACIKGTTTDFIGSVEFKKSAVVFDFVPEKFSYDGDFYVYGKAKQESEVELFVGDVKIADATVDKNGQWIANVSIPDAVVGKTYLITAVSAGNVAGMSGACAETQCVENALSVASISYSYSRGNYRTDSTVDIFAPQKKGRKSISTDAAKYYPFSISTYLNSDENVQELFLAYESGNALEYHKFAKDDKGVWSVYLVVGPYGLPDDLKLVGKVKDGDEVKEVILFEFIIQWIIDPSGYIYEAVSENRVEGAIATIYYKDESGNAVKWNAEEFEQENPLTSDENGNYGWFVPAGEWMVKAEKEGYITKESEWLPVPPPQLDVNLELVSTMQPKVAGVDLAKDKMLVRFDNYVLTDSFTKEIVSLKDTADATVEITSVEAVDAKERNEKAIAKEFTVTFAAPIAEGTYTVTVAAGVKSYADVAMSESQTVGDLTPAGIVKDITTPQFFVTKAGKDCTFEVFVVSDEDVSGRLLTVTSADESKVKVVGTTVAADAEGKATITLNGPAMTVTEITIGVENSSFTKTVSVMVIDDQEVFNQMIEKNELEKPEISSGSTEPEEPSVSDNDVPKNPESPSEPTDPEEPSDPTEPKEPSVSDNDVSKDPKDPSELTDSENPSDSTESKEPLVSENDVPRNPEAPSELTDSENPSDSTESKEPLVSENDVPKNPETPSEPTVPEDPSEPESQEVIETIGAKEESNTSRYVWGGMVALAILMITVSVIVVVSKKKQ